MALVLLALGASACGSDLGEADKAAAQELVYGRGGLVATKGQALVHDSCGNAAFCHSSKAKGSQRFGAPANLNFDMLPEPTGWPVVVDHRDDIWSIVLDGDMPPKGTARTLGDGDWVFDSKRGSKAEHLPKLASEEGKAVLRNWLASGAPVVAATSIPAWAQAPSDEDAGAGGELSDWSEIYAGVIEPSCALAGCHNAQSAAGGLAMGDACSAYEHLLAAGSCGKPRLTPGDGDSLLLDKLESDKPSCGMLRMPPAPFPPLTPALLSSIRAWIVAGAPAAKCM
jgi:hypothetical protein